jgi:hypothetical protein
LKKEAVLQEPGLNCKAIIIPVPVVLIPTFNNFNMATEGGATVSLLKVESIKFVLRLDNIFILNKQIWTKYLLSIIGGDNM